MIRSCVVVALTTLLGLVVFPEPGLAQTGTSIFSVLETGDRRIGVGGESRGALTDADVLSAGGRRVQVWVLDAPPGEEIQVDLRSSDFDPFLYVVGPGLAEGLRDDDSGNGLNSRLCLTAEDDTGYRMVASSYYGETGSFTLSVSSVDIPGTCGEVSTALEVTDLNVLPTAGRVLAVGDEVAGALTENDAQFYGSPVQAWAVQGVAGAPFSVDFISGDFDPYLTVLGPGLDEGLIDDDGAGRCDSRITLTFPESGEYRVVLKDMFGGTGSFTLIASETPGPASPESCIPTSALADEYEEGSLEEVAIVGTLPMGGFVNGAMSDDDGRLGDRSLQGWTLEGRAGARVAVTLRANDFDPYLYLDGPGFSEPLSDDDSAGDMDSRICTELPETGTYRVFAGPYSTAEAGATYRLEAADEGIEYDCETFTISLMNLDPEGRTIGLDELQEGVLTDRDPRHPVAGQRIQPWRLRGPAEASVVVDVVSDAFDAVLYAWGEGLDEALYVDDYVSGEVCNSRLELVLPPSGEIMLFPGAYSEAGEGPYLLRVSIDPPPLEVGGCMGTSPQSSGSAADPQDLSGLTRSVGDLPRGAEVEGALGPGDDVLGTGAFGQGWSYEGRAGDELAFELLSDAFDAVLYLLGPGLSSPLVDDDGAGNLNSRIEITLPEDGLYTLVVSALEAGSEGAFRLRAFRRVVR